MSDQTDYTYRIESQPDFAFLTIQLNLGQTVKVEASAMASMDTNIAMKTRFKGGLGRFLTGESLFINEFTADSGPGELTVAPGAPGDLDHVYLQNDVIFLQNSSYVASGTQVTVETKWQGLTKGFFSGESLFLIRCSGVGDLWFATYGSLIKINVEEEYIVDTAYVVAFTEGLDYSISRVGGYKSLFLSGEGLVCRFRGRGTLWIQTRQVPAFASWLYPYRSVKSNN